MNPIRDPSTANIMIPLHMFMIMLPILSDVKFIYFQQSK